MSKTKSVARHKNSSNHPRLIASEIESEKRKDEAQKTLLNTQQINHYSLRQLPGKISPHKRGLV